MATDDTHTEGVPGRYAAALFELAKENSKIADVEADLGKFQKMLDASEELRSMVRSPVIPGEEQAKAIGALLAKAGPNFLASGSH